jgi:hypothetical protein
MGGVFVQLSCDEKRARILLPGLACALRFGMLVMSYTIAIHTSVAYLSERRAKISLLGVQSCPSLASPTTADHNNNGCLARYFIIAPRSIASAALAQAPGCRSVSLVLKTWGKIAPQLV